MLSLHNLKPYKKPKKWFEGVLHEHKYHGFKDFFTNLDLKYTSNLKECFLGSRPKGRKCGVEPREKGGWVENSGHSYFHPSPIQVPIPRIEPSEAQMEPLKAENGP